MDAKEDMDDGDIPQRAVTKSVRCGKVLEVAKRHEK